MSSVERVQRNNFLCNIMLNFLTVARDKQGKKMKVRKAVIPVAGKGTRFLPATKQLAKEMLPVIKKPMIQYVVEEAVNAGIEQIIFVTSSGKETIENYFDRNLELEAFLKENSKIEELNLIKKIGEMTSVIAIRQKEQLGLGHAILMAEDVIGDEDFAVLLGDDIILNDNPVTAQLIETHEKHRAKATIGVMEVERSETSKYGIVDGQPTDDTRTIKMNKMVEKPKPDEAPSCLATPGRYIFNKNIFEYLKEIPRGAGGEYQLTDAINLMASKEDVYAHTFEGDRFDTGSIAGYLNATVEFALRDPETKQMMTEIIKDKCEQYKI